MNQDVRDSLIQGIDRLLAIYQDLTAGNRAFLEGLPTAERLSPLLDQREVSFAELRDLEEDLAATLRDTFPQETLKGLPEVLSVMDRELPDARATIAGVRTALSGLVASDREMQTALQQSRDLLETEIHKIRKGANLLKGYLQPDETGSCFIDKVK